MLVSGIAFLLTDEEGQVVWIAGVHGGPAFYKTFYKTTNLGEMLDPKGVLYFSISLTRLTGAADGLSEIQYLQSEVYGMQTLFEQFWCTNDDRSLKHVLKI